MESKPDPAASFLRRSVGSRSTDLHLRRPYADSPWIRRLHLSPSPPTPPPAQSSSARGPTAQRHYTISTDESRTSLQLPQRDQEESGEVISGFGPFQFNATNRFISWQFPLVARIARFSCEERIENRRKEFKPSPFFQFRPPPSGARFPVQNFSQRRFSVKAGEADFHGDSTEAAPNISVQTPTLYVKNQEDEPFSYWDFGRITRNTTISSVSNVSSPENLSRKRSQRWG